MRGRARGHQERIVILAHQIEVMARKKTLRDVKHYLPKPGGAPEPSGTSAMLAMVRRFKAEQDKRDSRRQ
jgi:hypothetical protein